MELKNHFCEESADCCFSSIDKEEEKEPKPPLSVLQRLDRLDQLLQIVEEKHCLSSRFPCGDVILTKVEDQEQCKPISSALEEVHHKGTLMDRVAILEDRVLQLSLEVDSGNTSKSSSRGAATTEKIQREEELKNGATKEKPSQLDKLQSSIVDPIIIDECKSSSIGKQRWLGCFCGGR